MIKSVSGRDNDDSTLKELTLAEPEGGHVLAGLGSDN